MKPNEGENACVRGGGGGVPLFSLTEPVIPNSQQITAKGVLRIPDTRSQHS